MLHRPLKGAFHRSKQAINVFGTRNCIHSYQIKQLSFALADAVDAIVTKTRITPLMNPQRAAGTSFDRCMVHASQKFGTFSTQHITSELYVTAILVVITGCERLWNDNRRIQTDDGWFTRNIRLGKGRYRLWEHRSRLRDSRSQFGQGHLCESGRHLGLL